MYQKYYTILFILLWSGGLFAQIDESTMQVILEEVVVSSTKETNELRTLPGSISLISPRMMEERKINSIVDLSSVIPNFFVPNYGSKMSTPVYIRGIGERSTGQAIGLYVDNMPYLDKSVFNFEFMDVQRIEALRGPQGTLYGRNAMGGIVNVYTYSPLDYQRTKITLTTGNYGLFRANTSVSKKIGNKAGISLSGYYNGSDGFFENQNDGKRADKSQSAGGRFRFDYRPAEKWTVQLMANYDYSDQGAFPYGVYTDGKIEVPNYDYQGKYTREVAGSNVNVEFKNNKIIFTSSTGFQYFDDNLHMDLDYTPQPVFTNNQLQTERNWTQEFAVKSNTQNNYRWSFGAFGFSRGLQTNVTTTMGRMGIETVLQPILTAATANNPRAPQLVATDNEIPILGSFKTPAYGGAIFHQSTYNNLFFVDGLSLTAGIRFDYEKTELDYNASMSANIDAVMNGRPVGSQVAGTNPVGFGSMSFTEWLPKASLKYEFNRKHYVYFTTAKGYKAGGYNIQMFADVVQKIVEKKYQNANPNDIIPEEEPEAILETVSYRPEYSWNYEFGYKGEIINNTLYVEAAVFYVDVNDVLVTQFVESGHGRLLKNAGRAESMGVDLGLTAYLIDGLTLSANYGYARAILKDYKPDEATDYSGNFIPFAPQNTFSLGATYNRGLRNSRIIDRFNIQAQYNGAGRIYWTEANDVYQNFYGLLNLRTGVTKGVFELSAWTKNTLNTNYSTFYFETKSLNLAQKGAPFQMGVDLRVLF
jgi:outer membrane receptor protein involved in Fe transport